MKLHKIEIENLNSLHGAHEIDFDAQLANAPLFLIMGATGAGKTTILDAICLTLFGTTPRVRDEGGRSSVSQPGERMMSKGTWFCRAMLEFSLLDDQGTRQRYRAEWRCERTHESATGRVKNPERSLRKQENGRWDAEPQASGSRLKDYEDAFHQALHGMTEDSFLRSVMLAQGQFSAFLKADEKEKAAILERLTDTAQYKRIGERAGTVKRAKEKRVQQIDDLLDELPRVDKSSLVELEKALDDVRQDVARKKVARDQVRAHVEWLVQQAKLEDERAEAKKSQEQAQKNHQDHQDDFARLALARRARPAEKLLNEVDRLEADQAVVREKRPDLLEAVEAADKALEMSEVVRKEALERLGEARQAYEDELPEIKAASKLRVERAAANEELERAVAAEASLVAKLGLDEKDGVDLAAARAGLEDEQQRIGTLETRAAKARAHVAELLVDERLGEAKDVAARRRQLRDALDAARAREKQLDLALRVTEQRLEVAEELEAAQIDADTLAERIKALEEKEASIEEIVEARRDSLDASARAFETSKEALALSSKREALATGDPCPLCGSEEHPYLDLGTHAERDAKFARDKAVCEEKFAAATAKLEEAKTRAAAIKTKLAVATDKCTSLEEKKTTLAAKAGELDAQQRRAIERAGLKMEAHEDAGELTSELTGKQVAAEISSALEAVCEEQAAWAEAARQIDQADEAAQTAEKALAKARLEIERVQRDLEKLEEAVRTTADRRKRVEALDLEIKATLEGKDPDKVEATLKDAIAQADRAHKEAHSAQTDASEAAKVAREKLKAANERLEELGERLEAQSNALAQKLVEQDFADADALRHALLDDDDFAALREQTEAIEHALVRAKDRLEDATTRSVEHEKALPERLDPHEADLEALETRAEELDEAYKEVNQRFGQLDEKLSSRREELSRRRELQGERGHLEQDLKVWRRIYAMIGVNNGGAFQKYAQALNLRELIHRANQHLQKLAKRYSLDVADDDGTPQLDFTVRDGHHAGTTRPLSTLSGGETFLVSLAMALALADYRRLDLRMETLLLDEGFGTLDQEALAKALSLLNNLHLDGERQVGLISHVEGLKERIPYRVEVHKLGDGRSSIEVVGGAVSEKA